MRVLIADKLAQSATEGLELAGCAVTMEPELHGAALTEAMARIEPDVLVVRSTKVQAEQLAAGSALSLVIRAGAGVNTIDLDSASSRGIYVANCPGKNAIAVAELTIGHLINLDRRIADNVADLRAGVWAKKEYGKARGLHGLTLAVLGCGSIGQHVIRRAQAMGLEIRAWSRSLTPERAQALGVTFAPTPLDACRGANALTVHLAKNSETTGLVDRTLLDALAPDAYFVNTSRGELVDEAALLDAVRNRGLRAGLDVFAQEPKASERDYPHAIGKEPGVYGTHHIGASTQQATDAVAAEVVRIVEEYARTGRVASCVNLAEQSPATHVLVVRHADRVGVLAGVLDALREDAVNVQEMENIIFRGAQAACARIQVDRPPSATTLARIDAHPDTFATSLVPL